MKVKTPLSPGEHRPLPAPGPRPPRYLAFLLPCRSCFLPFLPAVPFLPACRSRLQVSSRHPNSSRPPASAPHPRRSRATGPRPRRSRATGPRPRRSRFPYWPRLFTPASAKGSAEWGEWPPAPIYRGRGPLHPEHPGELKLRPALAATFVTAASPGRTTGQADQALWWSGAHCHAAC